MLNKQEKSCFLFISIHSCLSLVQQEKKIFKLFISLSLFGPCSTLLAFRYKLLSYLLWFYYYSYYYRHPCPCITHLTNNVTHRSPNSRRQLGGWACVARIVARQKRRSGGATTRVSPSATPADSTSSSTGSTGPLPWGRTAFRRENASPKKLRSPSGDRQRGRPKMITARAPRPLLCLQKVHFSFLPLFLHIYFFCSQYFLPRER